MKILHINTYDTGGAAKACLRLHQGLLEENIDSKALIKERSNYLPLTFSFIPALANFKVKLKDKLIRIGKELKLLGLHSEQEKTEIALKKVRKGLEMFIYPFAVTDITESPLYKEADIIHLHWVASFLDWQSFFAKNTKPVVWTLHDQNPFLGIEYYAERFLGIDDKGMPIERKYQKQELQEEKKMVDFKKNILKNIDNLTIIAPSKWLLDESKKSQVFEKYQHFHIPNGFPIEVFKPHNKDFCREILGLPQNKKVILFVADSVENNRKGFVFLKKALEKIKNEEIVLCAIGSKTNIEQQNNLIELGKIQDERLMAMAYSAADVFVIPSLEDNLPNTMIESLLCGTPIIGFPVGGILDVLEDSENGYLCSEISVEALQKNIEKFLNNSHLFDRQRIAQKAQEEYALQVQAKKYVNLYHSILKT